MTDLQGGIADRLDFDLEYDGPALATHEMDVRQLAPSLLSTAALFRTLNRLAHPADPDITVNIRATSEGSFLIQLALIYERVRATLADPANTGMEQLLSLVVAMIALRRTRERKGPPSNVEQVQSVTRITWPDGTLMEVPADAWRLLDDPTVARPLGELVRPVSEPGVESMRIKRDGRVVEEVTTEDLPAFEVRATDGRQILLDTNREVYLTIRNVIFDPTLKWRFNDGHRNFAAYITDSDFNAEVAARQVPLLNGDVLRCTLRTLQWRDARGDLHIDEEVVRVSERLPPAEPTPTLFADDSEGNQG